MNIICVTGNLTRDPELRKTASGVSVVSATVAVTRAYKGPNGEKATDFMDIVAWDRKADYLSQYAHKGDKLEITGRLESREFQDRNNAKRIAWEIIVENVTCFNKKTSSQEERPEPEPERKSYEEDDMPF